MISGQKTYLKGLTKESASKIYAWVNQEELRAYTGTIYPVSEYEHEHWMAAQNSSSDRRLFLICDKATDEEIGTIGFKNLDSINRSAEIFVSIGRPDRIGGGYGTDAVNTLVDFMFNHLNIHRVYVIVFESNVRAIRSYEKSGFLIEGTLREAHFANGKYENTVVMGLLSSP